jgi:transposase
LKSKKPALNVTSETFRRLKAIARSRRNPAMHVERAKILLCYSRGCTIAAICRYLRLKRGKVDRCINKALRFGIEAALDDLPRSGRPRQITDEAITWLVSLACRKPTDFGYSNELWTTRLLSKHIRKHCRREGHRCLAKLGRGSVSKFLQQNKIKPHKVTYYLECRDPEFDLKAKRVLRVYRAAQKARSDQRREESKVVFISYDEKPGIQAIQNTAPDLPPVKGKHSNWSRDHEYRRLGTMSLLAGIDLVSGKAHHLMFDRHRSIEFIKFLKLLDARYPEGVLIRIILDNHSAHLSRETQRYLATVPNRFSFTFTPKHGSWLNLVEAFFAKMEKTVLRSIRVSSKAELKERIKKYFREENSAPVVFEWKYMLKSA